MSSISQRILAATVLGQIAISQLGFAQVNPLSAYRDRSANFDFAGGQAQYKFNPVLEQGLIAVYVFGSVFKPGVHYVPSKISLLEVLTLAGGPTTNAKVDRITVSSLDANLAGKAGTTKFFDLDEYFERIQHSGTVEYSVPRMSNNDIIYVPEDKAFFDKNTTSIITFVGAIASTILSIVLIKREFSKD